MLADVRAVRVRVATRAGAVAARTRLALVAVIALTATAAADSRTKELATGYTQEVGACRIRAAGVIRVATGAQQLVDAGQAEFAADLEQLRAGQRELELYCSELDAVLGVLADPRASYKALERDLDERDNKIRKLRASSKKVLDDLAPVIGKLIPAINARVGSAAQTIKKTPLKFPSGRAVDAPALAGTWSVSGSPATDTADYVEGKASATVTVRAADGTCADRRKDITRPAVDREPPKGSTWYVAYDKDTRRIRTACRSAATGSLVATLDEPAGVSTWPDLEAVMLAMLAARADK